MNQDDFIYYLDLNTFIVKDFKIHLFLNFLDFIFCYLSLIDGFNKRFNNNKSVYSIPNILSDFL